MGIQFRKSSILCSTPKSCRQKMSETPAPPASPVLSVDGQTPITGSQLTQSHISLSKDVMKENMRLEWAKNGESPVGEMVGFYFNPSGSFLV